VVAGGDHQMPLERQSQTRGMSYALKVAPMLVRDFIWRILTKYLVYDFHPLALSWIFGMILVPWAWGSERTWSGNSGACPAGCRRPKEAGLS
jgi:hypothetical protein